MTGLGYTYYWEDLESDMASAIDGRETFADDTALLDQVHPIVALVA